MRRNIWDFHGGVHPPENKTQSTGSAIATPPMPAKLILPLQQHAGNPSKPGVAVGDRVLKGQQIAAGDGYVSAPLHAPTSGTIAAIESHPIPHPSGLSDTCIILEPDGEERWLERAGVSDYRSTDNDELLELIRNAGIAGLGGAGFPTAVKLKPNPGNHINTLIVNAVECEPYITADDMLMRERADQIVQGIQIIAHILKPKETLIGIENNKPEAIVALTAQLHRTATDSPIEVVEVPTKYPSGGEKQLVQILTGYEVPNGGIPADIGVVCVNVGTAVAVYRAVVLGEPLISRITTITGGAVANPQNVETLLGTPISELLAFAGLDSNRLNRLIMGGPMMGYSLDSAELPIAKTTNCVMAVTPDELALPEAEQACIRCGMCAEACPASLLPQQLYWYSKSGEFDKALDHNLLDCIECGACSYVCPSNIPLVQYYRYAKGEIRTQEQEHSKSEHARLRFETRQARLEQEAAEKAAKRKARAEAAALAQKKKQAAAAADDETARAAPQETVTGSAGEEDAKAAVIQAALERTQAKKAAAQVKDNPAVPETAAKQDNE